MPVFSYNSSGVIAAVWLSLPDCEVHKLLIFYAANLLNSDRIKTDIDILNTDMCCVGPHAKICANTNKYKYMFYVAESSKLSVLMRGSNCF